MRKIRRHGDRRLLFATTHADIRRRAAPAHTISFQLTPISHPVLDAAIAMAVIMYTTSV